MPDMNMQIYEELQRHQLVTEFDIQSQSELDDYQIKLNNVDNPTQAQDNLIVGNDGKSLPHWNESIDFNTWIKTNIGTSGKRGLLIHGNSGLNNPDSISNTFVSGDDFIGDTLDSSKWDTSIASTATVSQSDKLVMNVQNLAAHSGAGIVSTIPVPDGDYVIESTLKRITYKGVGEPGIMIGFTDKVGTPELYGGYPERHGGVLYRSSSNKYGVTMIQNRGSLTLPENINVDRIVSIRYIQSSHDMLFTFPGGSLTQTYTNPIDSLYPFIQYGDYQISNYGYANYIHIRKYTPIEPTYLIGTPQNITVALKSLGRTGQ